MENRTGIGMNCYLLLGLLKSLLRDRNGVVADGHGSEFKFSVAVGVLGLRPIGSLRFQDDVSGLNRAMLWIVDDSANRAEDGGEGDGAEKNDDRKRFDSLPHRNVSMKCRDCSASEHGFPG